MNVVPTSMRIPSAHGRQLAIFLGGASVVVFGLVGLAWLWLHAHPARSQEDQAIYDNCLYSRTGNTVACDAYMRVIARQKAADAAIAADERSAETALFQQAAKLRAGGVSACQVESWAADAGFVGFELSEASAIPLRELQAGKCWSAPTATGGNPFCEIGRWWAALPGFDLSRLRELSGTPLEQRQSGTCDPADPRGHSQNTATQP